MKKNQFEKNIKVTNSNIDNYKIKSTKEVTLFLENDYNKDDIKIIYTGKQKLSYKNKKGEKIGTIKYYYQQKEIASEEVYLNKELKINYLKVIKENIDIIIIITTVITAIVLFIFAIKILKSK